MSATAPQASAHTAESAAAARMPCRRAAAHAPGSPAPRTAAPTRRSVNTAESPLAAAVARTIHPCLRLAPSRTRAMWAYAIAIGPLILMKGGRRSTVV